MTTIAATKTTGRETTLEPDALQSLRSRLRGALLLPGDGAYDMRRFSTGGTYVNFLTEEEDDERVRAAYGANYRRLVDLKTAWDPGNFLRMNKNIAPRRAR